MQYGSSAQGLTRNFGFPLEVAQSLYEKYHELYSVSDDWTASKLKEASKRGYAELAFGLRIRTPVLSQTIYGSKYAPTEAHNESKSVGNALIQSYGLLTTTAMNKFMNRVWNSKFKQDVLPVGQIHDSILLVIKNTLECLHWVNKNLIDCMVNIDLPELQHPTVKLEANLEIYFPDWANPNTLPNNATISEIVEILEKSNLR